MIKQTKIHVKESESELKKFFSNPKMQKTKGIVQISLLIKQEKVTYTNLIVHRLEYCRNTIYNVRDNTLVIKEETIKAIEFSLSNLFFCYKKKMYFHFFKCYHGKRGWTWREVTSSMQNKQ